MEGSPTNPFLRSSGLITVIKGPQDKTCSVFKKELYDLFRAHNSVKNWEDDLIKKAFKEIKRITEGLQLGKVIEFRACEIITKVDSNSLRRRKIFMAFCGASVSIACRELKVSRSLKEISKVVKGVELKYIYKASRAIKSLLGSNQVNEASPAPQVIINTAELVRQFRSKLQIEHREAMAIRQAIENITQTSSLFLV